MNLPSTKPYLIRAIHQWCSDNGFTPYIAVVVDEHTHVPREFVREGQIVLNVGYDATNRLQMGNEVIEFQARFGGVARELSVPVGNVVAVYSREHGAGMAFEPDGDAVVSDEVQDVVADAASVEPEPPTPPSGGRPKLQRIK